MFRTAFKSAQDILTVFPTHIQIHAGLIVPRTFIRDIYANHGIVEFNNGLCDYIGGAFYPGLRKYYATRPKCHCGVHYKSLNKKKTHWVCAQCKTQCPYKDK